MQQQLLDYHKNLQDIINRGDSNEHSFRTAFENLLNSLKPNANIHIIHEPKAKQGQRSIRPDFKVYTQMQSYESLLGFVECKNFGADLSPLVKGKQIAKYLSVCHNIILTDYNRFILLNYDKIEVDFTLFKDFKSTPTQAESIKIQNNFSQLLQRFFGTTALIADRDELVKVLSSQSFYLSYTISNEAQNDLESQNFKAYFDKSYQAFRNLEHTDLSIEEFCDILAQSIVYGMFVAHIDSKSFEIDKIPTQSFAMLLPEHFAVLKEFIGFSLPLANLPESIKYALENIIKTITLIDKPTFQREIRNITTYLYEDFLKEYDNLRGTDNKKSGGVYYTPEPIVSMIVRSIDELLHTHFDKSFSDECVKVLDFATGTGSFLEKVFEIILENKSEVFTKETIINKCFRDIYGFEISFVPYIVAHLKLSSLLREKGFSEFSANQKFQVYLTNTLDLDTQRQIQLQVPFDNLKNERDKSLEIKSKDDLLVILGNPPYNMRSNKANKGTEILNLLKSYKQGLSGYKTNIQPLDDDYVKFIRFAQWKLTEQNQKHGIMGFITNNSYLNGTTHRKMRESLAKSFDEIYILNLHGNNDIDCKNDKNVFDIQQGVCISIFVKYEQSPSLAKSIPHPKSLPQGEGLSLDSPSLAESHFSCSPSLAEGARGWVKTDKSQSHRQLAPYMKEFSREMRKNPTDAENKLWQELRGKKLGFRFRRQFVIDSKYIADFVCLEKRLIIECDGGQHAKIPCKVESKKSPLPCGGGLGVSKNSLNHPDIQRDFYLESQNFRILRFWNNEILENLEGVLCVIKETLESDFAFSKSTHPLTPSAREGELDSNLAQIHYFSTKDNEILRRKDKFALLNKVANKGLKSIKWKKLKLDSPYFWFVPKDLRNAKYNNFWALAENVGLDEHKIIFKVFSSGIEHKRNALTTHFNKANLKAVLDDFLALNIADIKTKYNIQENIEEWLNKAKNDIKENLKYNGSRIQKMTFRPFDFRYTYYSNRQGFLRRSCYETMSHFLNKENLGICTAKITEKDNFQYGFITDKIVDRNISGQLSNSDMFIPLYLYENLNGNSKIPNFTKEFSEFIAKHKVLKSKSPAQILAFIYANLYNPAYRAKYLEYLKIGFPRIDFEVSESKFESLANLGQNLIDLHLMRIIPNDNTIDLKFREGANKTNPNFTLDKPKYENEKIALNSDLEIVGISQEVWDYTIGGYKVLDKWLKYRTGLTLEQADFTHILNVAKILKATIAIQSQLAEI